jgi:hypothetical protein
MDLHSSNRQDLARNILYENGSYVVSKRKHRYFQGTDANQW